LYAGVQSMRRPFSQTSQLIETLEARGMMSVAGLAIGQTPAADGVSSILEIRATTASSHINVTQTTAGLVVSNNGSSETLTGNYSSMEVFGGAGNDAIYLDPSVQIDATLYGGGGRNTLVGGSGDDTLVSIGSKADTLNGGAGFDSFWTDNTPAEKIIGLRPNEAAAGAVHRVSSMYTGTTAVTASNRISKTKSARVAALVEPTTTDGSAYQDFSTDPLFSTAGPAQTDIRQGSVGDCFFLSTLAAVAKVDPQRIRQSIVTLADGTYLVQFTRGNSKVYVHIDGKLPTYAAGQPDYAQLGAQNSTWVALMEKAFVVFNGRPISYSSIDGGWMDSAFSALGGQPADITVAPTPASLLSQIQALLAAGKAVTFGVQTPAAGAPLLPDHAYTVESVVTDSNNNLIGLKLRNPWGVDGAGNDGNDDGIVTLTPDQAYDSCTGIVSASM
jgi:hypothetical protein